MATYKQMIENLANAREVELKWNEGEAVKTYGYSSAIADMFGKSREEVLEDMKAVLVARGW